MARVTGSSRSSLRLSPTCSRRFSARLRNSSLIRPYTSLPTFITGMQKAWEFLIEMSRMEFGSRDYPVHGLTHPPGGFHTNSFLFLIVGLPGYERAVAGCSRV